MPDFDLVIFDLDGTLVDTETDVYNSLNLALAKMGLPTITMQTARKAIGPGPNEFIKYVLGDANLHRAEEFLDIFRPIYWQHCTEHSKLFDGILPLLIELRNKHIKLAIATNKARSGTDPILKALKVIDFFQLIMTRNEVENPKPAPEMILAACERLNVTPVKTLMLGDTDNDILAARAAGVKSCLALWGYSNHMQELKRLASFAVDHPLNVLELIESEIPENV